MDARANVSCASLYNLLDSLRPELSSKLFLIPLGHLKLDIKHRDKSLQAFTKTKEKPTDMPTSDFSEPHNAQNAIPLEHIEKSRWERTWPTIACGAGLFSDGYLNSFVQKDYTSNYILTNFVASLGR